MKLDLHNLTDDDLVKLGRIVSRAEWRTPVYQTYGIDDDERVAELRRKNDWARGRSLILLLQVEEFDRQ